MLSKPEKSENVSEKPKRGRPPAFPPELEAGYDGLALFDGIHSRRGRVNVYYRMQALRALKGIPGVEWVYDEARARAGEPGAWRQTILIELGRIRDPDAIRKVARQLCELKPTTREAVAMVRRWRLDQPLSAGDADQLQEHLRNALNDYITRHPAMPLAEAWRATAALLRDIEASQDDSA